MTFQNDKFTGYLMILSKGATFNADAYAYACFCT